MKKIEELKSEIKENRYNIMPNQKAGNVPLYKKLKAGIIALFAKDKNHYRGLNILKAGALIGAVPAVMFSAVACDVQDKGPIVEVFSKDFSSFSEFEDLFGEKYDIEDHIVKNVKNYIGTKYGSTVKIESIFLDYQKGYEGDIFSIIQNEGEIKILKFPNKISIEQLKAKVYKSGTYKLENDILKYTNQFGKEISVDLSQTPYYIENFTENLCTLNANEFEKALNDSIASVEEIKADLSISLTKEQESDFAFVMKYFLQKDTKAQYPNIKIEYNKEEDLTEIETYYLSIFGSIEKVQFKLNGDVTKDGRLDQDKAISQFNYFDAKMYDESNQLVKIVKKIYTEKGVEPYILDVDVDENWIEESNKPPEEIEINSWEELFNSFGEENKELVQNKLKQVFQDNVDTLENLKLFFGEKATFDNSKFTDIAINFDAGKISNFEVLGTSTSSINKTNLCKGSYYFLTPVSYDDIKVYAYKKNVPSGKNILTQRVDGVTLVMDFSKLITSLNTDAFLLNIEQISVFSEEFLQSQSFAYDLLTPLMVKEGLILSGRSFTNAEVYYKPGSDDVYGRTYEVDIKLFDQNSNDFITAKFILDNDGIGTIEEILQSAVNRNEYKIGISTNEKVFEGDWQWALVDIPPKFTIPEVNELEK